MLILISESDFMREIVLSHLQQKRFQEIIEILKDNKTFNLLISDEIFKRIFFQHFTNELFNQENLELTYPAFLYHCHTSQEYTFQFDKEDEVKMLKFLIDQTKDYNYAIKLPEYETSVELINKYNLIMEAEIKKGQRSAEKHRDFKIAEKYSNNTEHFVKSIFNSPQEKEFYLACKEIFASHLILPNVSLTTLFNSVVVKERFPNYFTFYQKSSIDFVIVDETTFLPLLFFELDSKTFHSSDEAKARDEMKNLLITESGHTLIRIMKRTGNEGTNEYVNFLNAIKKEYKI